MIDLQEQWDRVMQITREQLMRRRGDIEIAAKYELMLSGIRHDRHYGDAVLLGLFRAPGSKERHHAVEGGLVAHLLEMWYTWLKLRNELLPANLFMTDTMIWCGILHHDLNKVWRYRYVPPKEGNIVTDTYWKVEYAEGNQDRLSYLLPNTFKSLAILNRYGIALTPLMMNALITAEGGFNRNQHPKTETVFAKLLYICDELSANVLNRLETNTFWDSKQGGLDGDADF